MFIQYSGVVPKYRPRRKAVSPVIDRVPLTIALTRFAGTWMAWASWFMETPKSESVSFRISPGCTGGSFLGMVFSMIIDNLNVVGVSLFPSKADPVLIVDPDAVLARAVALERLQAVSGRDQKIGEEGCRMKR